MDRKTFLKSGIALGSLSVLPSDSLFAQSLSDLKTDKLTDESGNFVLTPLPYKFDFLEPYMDAETLNLHYTFHHGGAVKSANKDMEMIKKALSENNFETIDFW